MSYCRFSSMNWMCDVYAYADMDGGWTVHVAKMGRPFPPIPRLVGSRISMAIHRWSRVEVGLREKPIVRFPIWWRGVLARAWMRFAILWDRGLHYPSLDVIPLRPIGLPYDGDTIWTATAGECADVLQRLQDIGYRVPRSAIKALLEEEAESNSEDGGHG